ncbi:MAG: DMT family transporter [Prolixibacteraceae bacterium]|jgi:drug/metabolite transporter (DMT)-like permease|nr:DMT family transporter [Prolixibacteraceae bacterium]MBT6763992.1 DMT family transporter [Prolixibacteraceae bacterium]MBT6999511.1 DMT family transporter [Prolixibacteraceae bacterium]MBT7395901.1 DMT family transporter [Prolixibacteraceae bacterium]
MQNHFGEIAAILTAVFWTVTSLAFESAGKKVGSLAVNLIRLVMAFFFLGIFTLIARGVFFPTDATLFQWKWLALSGLVGFVIGDLLLFQAFVVIGARISMLMMALTPPFTAFISWLILGEVLTQMNLLGMVVTLTGIILVILKREKTEKNGEIRKKIKSNYSVPGILLALGGALGQATGLVLSKKGMGDYDAFSASQIRVLTGIVGFAILFFFMNRWPRVWAALKHRPAMKRISLGAFFGPFLGVSFSLLAVQNTKTGIAATLMAIVPVLIIPPAVILFKEKLNWKEILGAVITVGGVALFFL